MTSLEFKERVVPKMFRDICYIAIFQCHRVLDRCKRK